jgi:putative transposase
MDNNSLSHTKYNYKYHIVFAPKFRRKEIYGELKKEIGVNVNIFLYKKWKIIMYNN